MFCVFQVEGRVEVVLDVAAFIPTEVTEMERNRKARDWFEEEHHNCRKSF